MKILIALFFVILGCSVFAAEKPRLETLMYLIDKPESISSFRAHAQQVSIIAPQCFTMDSQGFVHGEVPAEVLEIAHQHGVAVMPLVVNGVGFDQPLMHAVLDSPEARARAIRYLLYYALRDGYTGIQFDYENIHYSYRDKFTQFVREAAREFHQHGLKLSIAVVGKISDDRNTETPGGYDNWSGVYDYKKLGEIADFLSIMAYPQHGGFSDPGPLAGVPWVKQVVTYSLSQVPARKLSLGVPLYGTRWTAILPGQKVAAAEFVQDNEGSANKKWTVQTSPYPKMGDVLAQHKPLWDDTEQAYRIEFVEANAPNVIWYEDSHSLAPKLSMSKEARMPGISAWVLGEEDPALWTIVESEYRVTHPKPKVVSGTVEERAKKAGTLLEER
jgi:spore germination protein YaaH